MKIELGTIPKNANSGNWRDKNVTSGQRAALQKQGVSDIDIDNMSRGEASDQLSEFYAKNDEDSFTGSRFYNNPKYKDNWMD